MSVAPLAYTFGTFLILATIVVWVVSWVIGAISLFRRGDLGAGGKALWLVVLLVLPLLGLFVFYIWQAANPDRSAAGSG